MFKKYLMYLIRWQLSTPILAVCVVWLASLGTTWATIIANFIGGLIFFWVDKWIFNRNKIPAKDIESMFEFIHKAEFNAPDLRYEYIPKGEVKHRLRTTYDFYQNLNCEFDDVFEGWSEQTKRRWFNHINAPYKDAIRKCAKGHIKECKENIKFYKSFLDK